MRGKISISKAIKVSSVLVFFRVKIEERILEEKCLNKFSIKFYCVWRNFNDLSHMNQVSQLLKPEELSTLRLSKTFNGSFFGMFFMLNAPLLSVSQEALF